MKGNERRKYDKKTYEINYFLRPELEDERERLATSACDVQRRLQETEAKILHTLAASQGNILESEEAIQVLQEAKVICKNLMD